MAEWHLPWERDGQLSLGLICVLQTTGEVEEEPSAHRGDWKALTL